MTLAAVAPPPLQVMASEETSNVVDFVREAQQSLDEVRYAITAGWISEKLGSTRECSYMNVTTLEGEAYCIRLTWRGFEVVGRCHDDVSEEESPGEAWETVYSLLSHISPSYTANFSKQVADKLNRYVYCTLYPSTSLSLSLSP